MVKAVIRIGLTLCVMWLSLSGHAQNYEERQQRTKRVISVNKKWAVTTKYASEASLASPVVTLWRLPGWHRVRRLPCGPLDQGLAWHYVDKIVFSPNGRTVAVAYSILQRETTFPSGVNLDRVVLWDLATGSKLHVLNDVDGSIDDVQFSSDGKTLFIANSDEHQFQSGVISLDVATWRDVPNKLNAIPNPREDNLLWQALSPGGKWLAQNIGVGWRLLQVATGRQVSLTDAWYGGPLRFSPDGSRVIYHAAQGEHPRKTLPIAALIR